VFTSFKLVNVVWGSKHRMYTPAIVTSVESYVNVTRHKIPSCAYWLISTTHWHSVGLPPQVIKNTGRHTVSQFVSQHWRRLLPRTAEAAVLRVGAGGGRHLLQWGPIRGCHPWKLFEIFWMKINSCKSAKYHTFPFHAVLRVPSTG